MSTLSFHMKIFYSAVPDNLQVKCLSESQRTPRNLLCKTEKQMEKAINTAAACSGSVDTSCSTNFSIPSLQSTVFIETLSLPLVLARTLTLNLWKCLQASSTLKAAAAVSDELVNSLLLIRLWRGLSGRFSVILFPFCYVHQPSNESDFHNTVRVVIWQTHTCTRRTDVRTANIKKVIISEWQWVTDWQKDRQAARNDHLEGWKYSNHH